LSENFEKQRTIKNVIMSNHIKKTFALLVLAVAYAFLFYHCQMGINLLIFDGLLLTLALWIRPELANHRPFIWSVGGLLFSAITVVVVNSNFSLFAHHVTYFLVLGFAQDRELRFIWFGLLLGAASLLQAPLRWWRSQLSSLQSEEDKGAKRVFMPWLKQAAVPVIIMAPFLFFYLSGNGKFADILGALGNLFGRVSVSESTLWTALLMAVAGILSAGLFFPRSTSSWLVDLQAGFRDELLRKCPKRVPKIPVAELPLHYQHRQSFPEQRPPGPNPLALRHEYRQSIITFGLLNLLLAAVNLTDLRYVWLSAGELDAATLSHYVHVGTWNLVISIFLAMAVVLFYFRGNLNFLKDATALPPLARLWLIQNAVLAVSVGIRNWHYIDAYGLAMGRIYVAFVLLLILFGLFTLWQKVGRRLTISYLFQSNGMAVWLAMLLLGAVSWTNVVTRYNLATQEAEEVDWYYLVDELPNENAFLLEAYDDAHSGYSSVAGMNYKMLPAAHHITDWRSWNYSDWRNWRALR